MTTEHHDFERDLGTLLRRTGDDFLTDTEALLAEGLRRGRARQWRRRAAMATGAASAAAVALAAVLIPGLGDDGSSTVAAPSTGEDMVETLDALLPDPVAITRVESAAGYANEAAPHVLVELDDGVSLHVSLERYAGADAEFIVEPGCIPGESAPPEDCVSRTLADGSLVSAYAYTPFLEGESAELDATDGTGAEGDAEAPSADDATEPDLAVGEALSWGAWRTTPARPAATESGVRSVSVTLARDTAGLDDPVAYEPPLSLEQLADVAAAEVWQETLDEVDRQYGAPEEEEVPEGEEFGGALVEADVPPERLREIFGGLAPDGLRLGELVAEEQSAGSAYFPVSSPAGNGEVSVNAWVPDPDAPPAGEDGGAPGPRDVEDDGCELLPDPGDGTRIFRCVSDAPDSRYILLDLYYPDGSSIDISVDAAGGPLPLTVEELTEIAADDAWRDLLA
ncbi:hypothetical protein RM780_23260 [Streptomyces sp. DSM 44917]|uniref:DUF4179 domain-containing protein n=1 Tax=Streptomyces boetiae TaxID=3075541 RepID=A0ABU2LE30_9ACTN|nr:hypothetical protein [Streptomyces sp. DSM 44917]MDT0309850.1 hypothetical protein [Streptomyces sp. DSM 44917]